MFRFSLRFWALMQYVYSLFSRNTGNDRKILMKEIFLQSVVRGHVDRMLFVCMDDDYPGLRTQHLFSVDRLMHMAFMRLQKYRGMDRRQSGLLGGFIETQAEHLNSCRICQELARKTILEEVQLSRFIKDVVQDGVPADPPTKH